MGHPRRGYVLIGVLAALTLAGSLAGAYALAARRGVQGVRVEIDRARAQALARGGAVQAAKIVALSMGEGFGAGLLGGAGHARASTQIPGLPAFPPEMANAGGFLGEIARKVQELEKRQAEKAGRTLDERGGEGAVDITKGAGSGDGSRPPPPPPPALLLDALRIPLDGTDVEIALECETGKLDINDAPREALLGLLVALGETEPQANATLDAIERYKVSLTDANSVARRVESLGFRERPLLGERLPRIEMLLSVPGMQPALYERLVPHLTTIGRRPVDPNYASREVWKALGVRDDRAIDRLEQARRQEPRLTRETLIGVFGASVFGAMEDMLSDDAPPVFTVRATARTGGATGRHLIRIGLDDLKKPVVLESREGWL